MRVRTGGHVSGMEDEAAPQYRRPRNSARCGVEDSALPVPVVPR